jgi:hypothetical protein
MDKFSRETDRFFATDEARELYTIIEITEFFRHHPGSSVSAKLRHYFHQEPITAKGLQHYRLIDGSPVNGLKDGTFEIVESGKIL